MRIFALAIATASMVGAPVVLQAQTTKACMQAEMDAQKDVNGTLWIAAGFFFGLLGIGAAYIIEPDPPMSRLVGKSPEYVAAYTDCYKRAGRSIQVNKALIGCVANAVVITACYGAYCCVVAGAAGAAGATY